MFLKFTVHQISNLKFKFKNKLTLQINFKIDNLF